MTKSKIIVVGAGGHAKACIDVIEANPNFKIFGLIGQHYEVGRSLLGYTIIGTDEELSNLKQTYDAIFIGIGQIKNPDLRVKLFEDVRALGFILPSFISPTAYVSQHATIGDGTIVMSGAIVGPGAKVGHNCIINSQALIEHDVVVGDHCHISTGARLNGAVSIGAESFVGSGAILMQGINVGDRCILGMGTLLRNDLSNQTVYVGGK